MIQSDEEHTHLLHQLRHRRLDEEVAELLEPLFARRQRLGLTATSSAAEGVGDKAGRRHRSPHYQHQPLFAAGHLNRIPSGVRIAFEPPLRSCAAPLDPDLGHGGDPDRIRERSEQRRPPARDVGRELDGRAGLARSIPILELQRRARSAKEGGHKPPEAGGVGDGWV